MDKEYELNKMKSKQIFTAILLSILLMLNVYCTIKISYLESKIEHYKKQIYLNSQYIALNGAYISVFMNETKEENIIETQQQFLESFYKYLETT